MTHIIGEPCLGTKDGICVEFCPVDCIHTSEEAPMFYIDPDECIDCGACVPVCPVEAIFPDDEVPEGQEAFEELNAAFFRKDSR